MNVLAIDTTANRLELALASEGQTVGHHFGDAKSRPSRDLHLTLRSLLANAGLTLKALDLIVALRGPGSFTGLRIGLAAAKTFSRALGVPAIGLDSLHLLAVRAGMNNDTLVHAVINTYRDEMYLQSYRRQGGLCQAEDNIKLITVDRLWQLVGDDPVMMRRIPQRHAQPLDCPSGIQLLDPALGQDLVFEALQIGPMIHQRSTDAAVAASLEPLYIKVDVASRRHPRGAS